MSSLPQPAALITAEINCSVYACFLPRWEQNVFCMSVTSVHGLKDGAVFKSWPLTENPVAPLRQGTLFQVIVTSCIWK